MTKASRRYRWRFGAAMSAYMVLLLAAGLLVTRVGEGPARYAVMLPPVPALVAVVWAVVGYLREADEFQSRSMVEATAIGFAGGSLTTFTYGLLQVVGAPQLNWMLVWVVYAIWWMVGAVVVRRHYS